MNEMGLLTPYFQESVVTIYNSDALCALKHMADCSVQTCVTSPPYWGLRDYGVEGQIGMEKTPEEYVSKMVEVYREVRRVLKDDGTLWLNLGDSFYGSWGNYGGENRGNGKQRSITNGSAAPNPAYDGLEDFRPPTAFKHEVLKPKDLVGIPWRVAFALQQPYYSGRIKRTEDRIWLAAMIEAEGCLFIHKRKEGQSNGQGYCRKNDNYSPGLEVANTHRSIVERCMEITGLGSICDQGPEDNGRRKQRIYRWNLRTTECRDVIREVYPYLIAKHHQARLLCGCPSSGKDAAEAHSSLIALHRGGTPTIDFEAPSSCFESGYYLRSDIIWSKANPMPESVTDRPTRAHEYLFLLAKSERYHYDHEAIKERAIYADDDRKPYAPGQVDARGNGHDRGGGQRKRDKQRGHSRRHDGFNDRWDSMTKAEQCSGMRNKRSVWSVSTEPYRDAHFATFPTKLIEPCILAGAREGDVVLDPFHGAGTTAMVSKRLGRRYVGCELNREYIEMSLGRIKQEVLPL